MKKMLAAVVVAFLCGVANEAGKRSAAKAAEWLEENLEERLADLK